MAISKRTREMVYEKYNGHCAYCGRKTLLKDMQVDHFRERLLALDNIEDVVTRINLRRFEWKYDRNRRWKTIFELRMEKSILLMLPRRLVLSHNN